MNYYFIYKIFALIALHFTFAIPNVVKAALKSDDKFVTFVMSLPHMPKYHDEWKKEILDEIYRTPVAENSYDFEAHLGILFLMKEHWHCVELRKEDGEICRKYRRQALVLYEYFLRVYHQESSGTSGLFLPVKPQFRFVNANATLMEVVNSLSMVACFLFDPICNQAYENNFELLANSWSAPILENIPYEMEEKEENLDENLIQKFGKKLKIQLKWDGKDEAKNAINKVMKRMSKIAKKIKPKHQYYKDGPKGIWNLPFFRSIFHFGDD